MELENITEEEELLVRDSGISLDGIPDPTEKLLPKLAMSNRFGDYMRYCSRVVTEISRLRGRSVEEVGKTFLGYYNTYIMGDCIEDSNAQKEVANSALCMTLAIHGLWIKVTYD